MTFNRDDFPPINDEERTFILENQLIPAIKSYRKRSGEVEVTSVVNGQPFISYNMGLRDAKLVIEYERDKLKAARIKPKATESFLETVSKTWDDWDCVEHQLGVALGLWEPGQESFIKHKGVMWTNNPVGNFLHKTLVSLAKLGKLDHNEEEHQFRRAQPRVTAAAIRTADGTVWALPAPARHDEVILHAIKTLGRDRVENHVQGFLTNYDQFVGRREAWDVAHAAGQVPETMEPGILISEHLW